MNIVEQSVSVGDGKVFELEEFLSRPLYAHLAHNSDQGPRESPVWFLWDGQAIWIIGGSSFPANLKRDPRCALGIVDWDPGTGLSHHVGMRGKAEVLPFDRAMAQAIFRRYFGPDEADWDPRFDYSATGEESSMTMVRFTPETVVVRDQSYKPTRWAQEVALHPHPIRGSAGGETGKNPDQPSTKWTVHRQDDNGNCFVVETGLSRDDAERLVAMYEARGHKQTYWAEPATVAEQQGN